MSWQGEAVVARLGVVVEARVDVAVVVFFAVVEVDGAVVVVVNTLVLVLIVVVVVGADRVVTGGVIIGHELPTQAHDDDPEMQADGADAIRAPEPKPE